MSKWIGGCENHRLAKELWEEHYTYSRSFRMSTMSKPVWKDKS